MASQVNSIKHLQKSQYLSFWDFKYLQKEEHSQVHSMMLPSFWYQN